MKMFSTFIVKFVVLTILVNQSSASFSFFGFGTSSKKEPQAAASNIVEQVVNASTTTTTTTTTPAPSNAGTIGNSASELSRPNGGGLLLPGYGSKPNGHGGPAILSQVPQQYSGPSPPLYTAQSAPPPSYLPAPTPFRHQSPSSPSSNFYNTQAQGPQTKGQVQFYPGTKVSQPNTNGMPSYSTNLPSDMAAYSSGMPPVHSGNPQSYLTMPKNNAPQQPSVTYQHQVPSSNGVASHGFETTNGIKFNEETNKKTKTGQFSWVSPEGQHYEVSYVADAKGFQPSGSHLPTPPTPTLPTPLVQAPRDEVPQYQIPQVQPPQFREVPSSPPQMFQQQFRAPTYSAPAASNPPQYTSVKFGTNM